MMSDTEPQKTSSCLPVLNWGELWKIWIQ